MAFYQLKKEQIIPANLTDIWDFVSSPSNLQKITPAYMGFQILSADLPEKMYPGMIIAYRVRPIPFVPMRWVTEITHVSPGYYFVDEQRVGPYTLWHHEHHLKQVEGGVLMTDIVSYSPPFGFIGRIANWLFIKRQLNAIFSFRERAINQIFTNMQP